MDLQLKGRVAIITGAGQGIGQEIARVLAEEGVKVGVNDFFRDRAERTAGEIAAHGGQAMGLQADVTDLEQVRAMVRRVAETFGPAGILVNNAGVIIEKKTGQVKRSAFAESAPEVWRKEADLNFYGCLNCTHSVLPSMIERKKGSIVSIISEAGRVGEANLAVYSGAKAGVLGFTKAIAREVGRHAINANCIALGAVAHEGTKPGLDPEARPESDPKLDKMLKVYPVGRGLGRVGRPADAAHAVAFLVSPRAEFISGQCLSVSGGFTMVG